MITEAQRDVLPSCAIVIPTKNRPEFLKRLVSYYVKIACRHQIYIGDASTDENSQLIRSYLEKYAGDLSVSYHHLPNMSVAKTTQLLASKTHEKYISLICDDDFLVPSVIDEGIFFLENNSDYRTAQGRGILFELDKSGPYGKIVATSTYWSEVKAEAETAEERLKEFASHYWVPLFSVHRTVEFLEDLENHAEISATAFGELIACFMTIVNGKSKSLDGLYLVRQCHEQRYICSSFLDYLSTTEGKSDLTLFCQTIGRALARRDSISADDGCKIVHEVFHERYLKNFHGVKNDKKAYVTFRDVLKKSRLLRKLVLAWRSRHVDLGMRSMLKEKSPYYFQFKPVCDSFSSLSLQKVNSKECG